eukprot:CAMPEP_0185832994 /NCGR_PEP_ID=MMETSP1353-20130828/2414_1 /TAXON_ID=1077150 /ORGANISM="Erythrolobus australicus, Strain CCMP3124" /LENGTH=320 /DNA_ID=CAMNT_0028531235 /DNA_START=112 /DNA_END=1074 /DNA_ORIENTATION=+
MVTISRAPRAALGAVLFVALLEAVASAAPTMDAALRFDACSCSMGSLEEQAEAKIDWETCPLGTTFDPVAACHAANKEGLDAAPACDEIALCSSASCVNYERVLFGGAPSTADQAFVESMISICVTAEREAGALVDALHIQLAAEGADVADDAAVCRDAWGLATTEGLYCAREKSYRHSVVKIANILVEKAPLMSVQFWMDEAILAATEIPRGDSSKDLCISEEGAFELGQLVGDLVVEHFPVITAPVDSQADSCCHPVCYDTNDNFKSPNKKSPNGALNVAFEGISLGCCDVARVNHPSCVLEEPADIAGSAPETTELP